MSSSIGAFRIFATTLILLLAGGSLPASSQILGDGKWEFATRIARTGADSNSAAQRRHHGLQSTWSTGNDHRITCETAS
jgi:hypothetical protein